MKVKELQNILTNKKLDHALLITTSLLKKDLSVQYFSGLDIEMAFVLVPAKGSPIVFVSKLEEGRAKKLSKIRVIVFTKLFDELRKYIKPNKKIGINYSSVSLYEHKLFKKELKCTFRDISKDLVKLRETKTEEEIAHIKTCCKKTDEIFDLVINGFKKFKTEQDVADFIDNQAKRDGFGIAFDTTVNSGSNASYGHYSTTNEKLKKGFCIIDFGVSKNGYISDMTRTLYLGDPTKKEIETYDRIKSIQQKAIDSTKIGVKFEDIDKICREEIGNKMIHATGHGIGLAVHENPRVSSGTNEKVKPGHLFTIEPGEYVAGKCGIRIEDDVAVTEKGVEVLTKSTKELIIIN